MLNLREKRDFLFSPGKEAYGLEGVVLSPSPGVQGPRSFFDHRYPSLPFVQGTRRILPFSNSNASPRKDEKVDLQFPLREPRTPPSRRRNRAISKKFFPPSVKSERYAREYGECLLHKRPLHISLGRFSWRATFFSRVSKGDPSSLKEKRRIPPLYFLGKEEETLI